MAQSGISFSTLRNLRWGASNETFSFSALRREGGTFSTQSSVSLQTIRDYHIETGRFQGTTGVQAFAIPFSTVPRVFVQGWNIGTAPIVVTQVTTSNFTFVRIVPETFTANSDVRHALFWVAFPNESIRTHGTIGALSYNLGAFPNMSISTSNYTWPTQFSAAANHFVNLQAHAYPNPTTTGLAWMRGMYPYSSPWSNVSSTVDYRTELVGSLPVESYVGAVLGIEQGYDAVHHIDCSYGITNSSSLLTSNVTHIAPGSNMVCAVANVQTSNSSLGVFIHSTSSASSNVQFTLRKPASIGTSHIQEAVGTLLLRAKWLYI